MAPRASTTVVALRMRDGSIWSDSAQRVARPGCVVYGSHKEENKGHAACKTGAGHGDVLTRGATEPYVCSSAVPVVQQLAPSMIVTITTTKEIHRQRPVI